MLTTIAEREKEMLRAMKALGAGWHDRTELAIKLKKNRLAPEQVIMLDLLVEKGVLEKSMQPTHRPHIYRWLYKIVEKPTKTAKE